MLAPDGKVYAAGFVNQGGDQALAVDPHRPRDGQARHHLRHRRHGHGQRGRRRQDRRAGAGGCHPVRRQDRHRRPDRGTTPPPPVTPPRTPTSALARFDTTGKLDTTFGTRRRRQSSTSAPARPPRPRPSSATPPGAIGGGPASGPSCSAPSWPRRADRSTPTTSRRAVTNAGVLDTTFGTGGTLTVDSKVGDNPRASWCRPTARSSPPATPATVTASSARCSSAHVDRRQLDTTFGTGGFAMPPVLRRRGRGVQRGSARATTTSSPATAGRRRHREGRPHRLPLHRRRAMGPDRSAPTA